MAAIPVPLEDLLTSPNKYIGAKIRTFGRVVDIAESVQNPRIAIATDGRQLLVDLSALYDKDSVVNTTTNGVLTTRTFTNAYRPPSIGATVSFIGYIEAHDDNKLALAAILATEPPEPHLVEAWNTAARWRIASDHGLTWPAT